MSKKKFGSNRQREQSSENRFDSSNMRHRYRMLGHQQVPREIISGIHLPSPISNPNQFFIPTPHMWPPAPNPNFVSTRNHLSLATPHMWPPAPNRNFASTPQRSTINHFSLATSHMWAPTPNPNFAVHQGARNPFVCPAPQLAHPPHQNRCALQPVLVPCHPYLMHSHPPYAPAPTPNPNFAVHQGALYPFVCPAPQLAHPPHQNKCALQPVLVPCHPYLMHSHPPYAPARPVSSWEHALHNGGIVPRISSHQSPSFIPSLGGPMRIQGQMFNSAPLFHPSDPPMMQTPTEGCQFDRRIRDSDVPVMLARQADDADNLAPPFLARDPPTVQTPTEGCQCHASSLPREKDCEVTATSARQANNNDSAQNYSSPPAKASVADKSSVASITADVKTANEKSRAPGLVASSQFVLYWPGVAEIALSKSPDSATSCELPTNESVFYEWWEVAPASSHPQSVLASLGLEVRESWDGLNLMLEGLSKSSDDLPSSPQSVLASENLEKYSEGSDVTETLFDHVQKMYSIALRNPSDISCMSSLFDVGAKFTEELTEDLTAKKKYSMEFMLSLAKTCTKLSEGANISDAAPLFIHN